MADILMIHGIGQQDRRPADLEASWRTAVDAGLRTVGHATLADDVQSGRVTTAMAYYADAFAPAQAQGFGSEDDPFGGMLHSEERLRLVEDLARAWLETSETSASNPRDRRDAAVGLSGLDPPAEAQGAGAALPAVRALSRIRWFADGATWLASRTVARDLAQVVLYLTDPDVRDEVDGRVAALADDATAVIVGHSLGSVVAYHAAVRRQAELPMLVTMGSPLRIDHVVTRRLQIQPPRFPENVRRWVNVTARDDLVAVGGTLAELFSPTDPARILEDREILTTSSPHDVDGYLRSEAVGDAIGAALTTDPGGGRPRLRTDVSTRA